MSTSHSWHVLDDGHGMLYRRYQFTKGADATCFVFRGADGLVVVSPPRGLEPAEMDALRPYGEVKALVANNSLHHLGQADWRRHFPQAVSYAPPRAVAALDKKTPGVSYRPLTELPLSDGVRWEDPPGFKTGEAMLRVRGSRGWVWYTGDLLVNMTRVPGPPLKWIFTLTDSGPGFRLFQPAVWLSVKDKQAVRAWTLEKLAAEPPVMVVPAHGVPVDTADVADLARAQVERL
jgi:glyoxylase-like metal-dependent hydrolase (beta-lactamase superfamily II)